MTGYNDRPFKIEVFTDKGKRMTFTSSSEDDAIAMASEKFSLSFVSKVILSKDGTKLKVWS